MNLHQLERQAGGAGVLLVVYVHGWNHNASQCDNNVVCFARLVERINVFERDIHPDRPRPVIGIYVGWRGLSLDAPLTYFTFWTRKGAAERVGHGGVTELLTRLDHFRRYSNPLREEGRTQLITIGHSFGGHILYSALSQKLMDTASLLDRVLLGNCDDVTRYTSKEIEAARRNIDREIPGAGKLLHYYLLRDGKICYGPSTRVGDIVVLVNAAIEASQYEPLFNIATNRCYGQGQLPVMLTVTSTADSATKFWFPLGRRFSTLLEDARIPEQQRSMLSAIGHEPRYQTHRLQWVRRGPVTEQEREPSPEERDCGCPYLTATEYVDWEKLYKHVTSNPSLKEVWVKLTLASERSETARVQAIECPLKEGVRVCDLYDPDVQLRGDTKYSANYPFLVVSADPEIIPDHNSIYNEPFISFLGTFLYVHVFKNWAFKADDVCRKEEDVHTCLTGGLPCEVSCRLPDGRSCSGGNTGGIDKPTPIRASSPDKFDNIRAMTLEDIKKRVNEITALYPVDQVRDGQVLVPAEVREELIELQTQQKLLVIKPFLHENELELLRLLHRKSERERMGLSVRSEDVKRLEEFTLEEKKAVLEKIKALERNPAK